MKKDENNLYVLDGYSLTQYTKIKNCYISDNYKCDDLGVISYSKKEIIEVCSPISLVSIVYDEFRHVTYYEFQFLNRHTKKVSTILFGGGEIGSSSMVDTLKKEGLSIVNSNSFNKFVNMMIRSNEKIIDYNEMNDNPTEWMKSRVGSNQYGWVYTENGYIYDKFNFKDDIIYKNPDIDGPLFEKKGTLEEQLKTMNDIRNDFKNPNIFEMALTMMYVGAIAVMLGIDTPVFLLTGPSGCGKQFTSDEMVGQLGKNHMTGRGLQRVSGDTEASRNKYRTKFNILTIIYDEVQDLINKNIKNRNMTPSETIKELSYEITVGSNGSRSTDRGEIRDDMNISHCPTIFCCEGNQFSDMNDGGSSRILIIDSGLSDGEMYIKSNDSEQYRQRICNNYGHTYEIFVKYIQDMMFIDEFMIVDRFREYKQQIKHKSEQDKIINNTVLSILTHNLMCESGCVPSDWDEWDIDEISDWILSMNEFKSSTKLVMDSWIDDVVTNGCIPFYELSKNWTQSMYDEYSRNDRTRIRGKKEIIDNKLYIYIPENELIKQLDYVAKQRRITGFCYDTERLYAAGYLLKSGDKSHPFRHKKRNIVREYNPTIGNREDSVCVICVELDNDTVDEYKKELDKKSEELKKKLKKEETTIFDFV